MKKKWFKILLILAGIGVVAAVLGYIFIYNKPHPNYEKMNPDFTLTAAVLFNEYVEDSEAAGLEYNGKMVAVEGEVTLVESVDEQVKAYFVLSEGLFGNEGIRVTMLENHSSPLLDMPPGSLMSIKGYVTGYNGTDVIMEHGSLMHSYQ